jgi:hypothetical protein
MVFGKTHSKLEKQMKKTKIDIFKDGVVIRKHNTRISIVDSENEVKLMFERFTGNDKKTSVSINHRGVATTFLKVNHESMKEISSSWNEYLKHKNK